ncbi:hypothetical protein DID88_003023 [Monilinia fructigena]|uniref:Mitochondrial division protein 1 n=1 Tax=Monilinia fructigena TaxID=38457 RepID=A0A395IJT2_9HELO|nr:hypothetical protein DID88_003023 [Monilinia fructigena]
MLAQMHGAGPTSHPHPTLTRTSASPRHLSAPLQSPRFKYEVRPEALTASTYDIVPTIAAPQSTSINAITATPDMRYWFSGGSDCFIRKYNGVDTVNGKTLLTVAQRHPFVDSVVKAGVLMSYWIMKKRAEVLEGRIIRYPSLESGSINLQSVRHDEGKRIATLQKHTSAVSVLTLARDEKSVLSGSWDKTVIDWDLNTGSVKREFDGSGGQISAIEVRPASTLPVPQESGEPTPQNGTFSSNDGERRLLNGGPDEINGFELLLNGLPHFDDIEVKAEPETQDAEATSDSTFLAASIDGTIRQEFPHGVWLLAGHLTGTLFTPVEGMVRLRNSVCTRASSNPKEHSNFPNGSGAVSAMRAMPNGRHLICASHDILRLYDLKQPQTKSHSSVPFLIVPGPPRAGVISALHIDPTCKYIDISCRK